MTTPVLVFFFAPLTVRSIALTEIVFVVPKGVLMDAAQKLHRCDVWSLDRCNGLATNLEEVLKKSTSRSGGGGRFKVRKTFTLDPESIGFIDEICQARNSYSDLMKSTFVHNQSQVVRDAISLLYRFEVGKESLVHDEDPRFT